MESETPGHPCAPPADLWIQLDPRSRVQAVNLLTQMAYRFVTARITPGEDELRPRDPAFDGETSEGGPDL